MILMLFEEEKKEELGVTPSISENEEEEKTPDELAEDEPEPDEPDEPKDA